MKKLLVLVLVLCINMPAFAWTTVRYSTGGNYVVGVSGSASAPRNVVRYNPAGQPVNRANAAINTSNTVVKYNIAGQPIKSPSTKLKPTSSYVKKIKPTDSLNRIVTGSEPVQVNVGTTYSRRIAITNRTIGGAKPPRVASYCNGITYYKNGVPSCSNAR